jgi:predicted restriction endonuclease
MKVWDDYRCAVCGVDVKSTRTFHVLKWFHTFILRRKRACSLHRGMRV